MADALEFPLRHYDRVRSTLQTNKQLGMALLEGYDQIPQPTLDVYRQEAFCFMPDSQGCMQHAYLHIMVIQHYMRQQQTTCTAHRASSNYRSVRRSVR